MFEVELRFQVSVDYTGPQDDAAVSALRSWFDLGLSTVGAPYLRRIATQPPGWAQTAGAMHGAVFDYRPTVACGRIEYALPNRHGRRHTVAQPFSDAGYARFQSRAAEVLTFGDDAMVEIGMGYPSDPEPAKGHGVDMWAGRPVAAADTLVLTMDFPPAHLTGEVVAEWRRWLDEHEVTFGVVERPVGFAETVLEQCLRGDLLPQVRERLRGYGWLTIASRQVGDRLGGVDALRATGAFVDVSRARSGSYWLRATDDPHTYDMADADRVFRAVAPALPPGTPYPPRVWDGELPYLVVCEDASTVTT